MARFMSIKTLKLFKQIFRTKLFHVFRQLPKCNWNSLPTSNNAKKHLWIPFVYNYDPKKEKFIFYDKQIQL